MISSTHIFYKIALLLGAIFFLTPVVSQNLVELLPGSEKLYINKTEGYQKLVGNVRFKYQGHLMYCDSALFYDEKGELYAYSRVHINKQDTLNLFCDSLFYNTSTKLAKLWGNVRVRDREYKLVTDTLDYNAKEGVAIYRHGGIITHIKRNDKLTSQIGYYYPNSKNFFFKQDVVYDDDKYHILTDTMKFNSVKEDLFFYGSTHIFQKEDTTNIYCQKGFFNLKHNIGEFIDEAKILKPRQSILADTLRFNSITEISIGISNVIVRDSSENVEFRGEYIHTDGIKRTKLITDCAYAIYFQEDDTTYVNADTLFAINDTLDELEFMRAHFKVKIFSTKYQAVCDSMTYTNADSLMRLYREPILWNQNNQLTGEFMTIKRENQDIKHTQIIGKALSVSELDSGMYYNQLSGRVMDGYFKKGELYLLHVQGNAKTIFYPEDESENDTSVVVTRSGMNRLVSSELKLYLDSGEVVGLTNLDEPDGVFYGMEKIPEKEKLTENFVWHKDKRPIRPEDIHFDYVPLPPTIEDSVEVTMLPELIYLEKSMQLLTEMNTTTILTPAEIYLQLVIQKMTSNQLIEEQLNETPSSKSKRKDKKK